jgi:hypothetical protein
MIDHLKAGDEVSFPGLLDLKLIVEEVHELKGAVRCKYFDDHLKKYIELTLPADALIRTPSSTSGSAPAVSAEPNPPNDTC